MKITGIFELESHPGLEFVNPEIVVDHVIDYPQIQQYKPIVIITGEAYNVQHALPNQDYVNGSWEDADVQASLLVYFDEISR